MAIITIGDLQALRKGPFIGPRGGKWADARHTIPWGKQGKSKTHAEVEGEKFDQDKRVASRRKQHDKAAERWAKQATPQEHEAALAWAGMEFGKLRQESAKKKPKGHAATLIAMTERYAKSKQSKPTQLYRGLGLTKRELTKLKGSKTFTDKGLASWGPDHLTAADFANLTTQGQGEMVILSIESNRGVPITHMSDFMEREVLMAPNQKYKIKGVRTVTVKEEPYRPTTFHIVSLEHA
jgi:hypothetical protein